MPKEDDQKSKEYGKFEELTGKLVSVPAEEVNKEIRLYKRKSKKKDQGSSKRTRR